MVDFNYFLPFITGCLGFHFIFLLFWFPKAAFLMYHVYHFFWKPRVVGGLLSAYDLSEDKVFLDKARDIADRLLPAWDSPSGIPYNIINLAHGRPHNPSWTGVSSEEKIQFSDCLLLWYHITLSRVYAFDIVACANLFCNFSETFWTITSSVLEFD